MTVKLRTKKDIEYYESVINHKKTVSEIGYSLIDMMRKRIDQHDNSKLENTEFDLWVENFIPENKRDIESEEYKEAYKRLKGVREIHYSSQRHHLEFFKGDIRKINILDLMEIIIDWISSASNQDKGNLRLTIENNREKYKFSKDIESIILNTLELVETMKEVKGE